MIVESLQACLNDYNESAAGFVFEGFMAALTGGKQIAGKVAGTLPIEDFVAFSDFGADQPVSLKLLSGGTPVKGSFTNIVDFLLVRGTPAIKYLVAYKKTTGEGSVEKLNIFAFDITRENFVDFIEGSLGGGLFKPHGPDRVRSALREFDADGDVSKVAQTIVGLSGYSVRGLLHKYLKTGKLPSEMSPEEEEAEFARKAAAGEKSYARVKKAQQAAAELNEHLDNKSLTMNETFHSIEKQTLLVEGPDDKSQWAASLPQLERMGQAINWESFGELDLTQSNISELTQIYTDILGDSLIALLKETKDLAEAVGTYYTEDNRSKAQSAGKEAQSSAGEIKDILEDDPRYQKKT